MRSEVEERRQLLKLVLQNLRLEGKLVRYDADKPFNEILNYNDNQLGLPLKNLFINRELEFDYTLDDFKILYSSLNLTFPSISYT